MFENMTYESLLENALSKVPNNIDKRQGSIIYDAIAPICVELAQAYIDLDIVLKEGFADTCSREYLIKRAKERSIEPYKATKSIILAQMTGKFTLTGEERFSCDDLNFTYFGEMEGTYYKLECETAGTVGNISFGDLIPITNINGLETANIHSLFVAGIDEETTSSLRERYFTSFESQAFGGNRADYTEKVLKLNEKDDISRNGGIGAVKCYRTPTGNGTVGITIINNSFSECTSTLVGLVQEYIDPTSTTGNGDGIAPIGHSVTISSVSSNIINIELDLQYNSGYSWSNVQTLVENAIDEYFIELAKSWGESDTKITVVLARIIGSVIDVEGIADVLDIKVNGNNTNIVLPVDTIPIRGSTVAN